MKHWKIGFLMVVLSAVLAPPVHSMTEMDSFVTGRDWARQMTAREKVMSLLPPMALYNKFGVQFQRTVFEYVETMDTELAGNPYLEQEEVANIFASTVYALEPENRLPLERMQTVFGILKKRGPEDGIYPAIPLSEEDL